MGKVVIFILAVVLVNFNDKLENVHREKGDFFKCTPDRFNEIMDYNPNLIKAVPNYEDVPDPVDYTSDTDGQKSESSTSEEQKQEKSAADDKNVEAVVCDIAQLSDDELLKRAKEKKVRNASKMSREQLIEALQ